MATEEIAVIGGGLPGIITTILAAGITNPDGTPKYHITLIDKEEKLLTGASMIASRLHLGDEYPLDEPTAKDCLKSAVIWKLGMPKNDAGFYTAMPGMKFTIAPETEQAGAIAMTLMNAGEAGKQRMQDGTYLRVVGSDMQEVKIADIHPDDFEKIRHRIQTSPNGEEPWSDVDLSPTSKQCWTTDNGTELTVTADGQLQHLTYGDYLHHVMELRRVYAQLHHEVMGATGWDVSKTDQVLFGSPDKFYRPLDDVALRTWNVECGFQSNEPGIRIPYLHAYLLKILEKLKQEGRVSQVTGKVVGKPAKVGDQFAMHVEGQPAPLMVAQVALAANEGNPALGGLAAGEEVTVYNRAMLVLNTVKIPSSGQFDFLFSPVFKMLSKFGGMHCPYNKNMSVDYVPDARAAYRGGSKVLTAEDPHVPAHWHKSGYYPYETAAADIKGWIDDYFKLVIERFPHLKGATPAGLVIQNTMNFQHELSQRKHQASHEVEPGLTVVNANKATYAFRNAIEAVEVMQQRSQANQTHSPQHGEAIAASDDLAYQLALNGRYEIPDIGLLEEAEVNARAEAMGMDAALAEKVKGGWVGTLKYAQDAAAVGPAL